MIIDGKAIANRICKQLKDRVASLLGPPPTLAFILIGNDPASLTYITTKRKRCADLGIASIDKKLPRTICESDLLKEIDLLNQDPGVDGILIQLPLPAHISPFIACEAIDPSKDVDGFHPLNMGKLLLGQEGGFIPCTPLGIKTLLQESQIPTAGKQVVILGRSNIVGKPLSSLLIQNREGANATVTVAHSQTAHIDALCLGADILIAAIGKPHFIKGNMVKKGAVVIDVGINRLGSKLVGDVDFKEVLPKCSHITPVPGGVGPMTVATLLSNTLLSYEKSKGRKRSNGNQNDFL